MLNWAEKSFADKLAGCSTWRRQQGTRKAFPGPQAKRHVTILSVAVLACVVISASTLPSCLAAARCTQSAAEVSSSLQLKPQHAIEDSHALQCFFQGVKGGPTRIRELPSQRQNTKPTWTMSTEPEGSIRKHKPSSCFNLVVGPP